MKFLLAACLSLISITAFAQSYLILNNGVTLTTDKGGYIYDFQHFNLPYNVSIYGGNFFVENKKLKTIDAAGMLYVKDVEVSKIKGHGLNYLLDNKNNLITIDVNGFYYDFKFEEKPVLFGGKFITTKNKLFTVNDLGNFLETQVEGLKPSDISFAGGNFFQTKSGDIYTVSKDGFVYLKTGFNVKKITKSAGNFFIDETGRLFTITEEGFLVLPVLPYGLEVASIQKIGTNFMIDQSNKLFVVDSLGIIWERIIQHDVKNVVLR